jgi:hypothetical protein
VVTDDNGKEKEKLVLCTFLPKKEGNELCEKIVEFLNKEESKINDKKCGNCDLWESHIMSELGNCKLKREFPHNSLPYYTKYDYCCKDWYDLLK